MKANTLMDHMFDIQTGEICDDITDIMDASTEPVESIKDLSLNFDISRFSQFIWSVVTWLQLGHIPLIARQDFC